MADAAGATSVITELRIDLEPIFATERRRPPAGIPKRINQPTDNGRNKSFLAPNKRSRVTKSWTPTDRPMCDEVVATHPPMGFEDAISPRRVAAIFMPMLISPLPEINISPTPRMRHRRSPV